MSTTGGFPAMTPWERTGSRDAEHALIKFAGHVDHRNRVGDKGGGMLGLADRFGLGSRLVKLRAWMAAEASTGLAASRVVADRIGLDIGPSGIPDRRAARIRR